MDKIVLAVAAHPDDIEFTMAGTLFLLREAGWSVHYLNIANGSCGTVDLGVDEIVSIRREEAIEAASHLDARFHESLVNDLEIYYEPATLARVAAVVRLARPDIVLLQSPQDYMEDHQNSVRLGVSAAFSRGMSNFRTDPPLPPCEKDVAVYHAQPHGNRDALGELVTPHFYLDISPVLEKKKAMLACHRSQKDWLDRTQGMDSYVQSMVDFARETGKMSGRCQYAEGWRRRMHLGFCPQDFNPLREFSID